jgi:hypothetical protein
MSENIISYRKNYDEKNGRYWSVYQQLEKQYPKDLQHLLQTGLLLTPGKGTSPNENYRDFPAAPDYMLVKECVPLLHGKPIPMERQNKNRMVQ